MNVACVRPRVGYVTATFAANPHPPPTKRAHTRTGKCCSHGYTYFTDEVTEAQRD